MKLATLTDGTRDGRLAVVSRDLAYATEATGIAKTLQDALDDWAQVAPKLECLAAALETHSVPHQRFREAQALAPLPRAFQWIDGSAYLSHVELVRRARGATMPPELYADPLLYQGGSDGFLPPRTAIPLASEDWGLDFEGEVAVILNDVAMGASVEKAQEAILLVVLVNDVSLRNLIPAELAKGFGFLQSKPASALSPVAVTLDELGPAWRGGRLHLPLLIDLNGKPFGRANAGIGMNFDFPTLIAAAAKTRRLGAGTIIGSGTVSNKTADGGFSLPVPEDGAGYSCLAESRMIEALRHGAVRTPFLHYGDLVRIEMKDASGSSIFGAIEQSVELYA
ncbi:MAG: fumarylacetoacetate hydrolase family protein [Alphaproteobacteria bacterium]|nr:fumarylacetoacetate hydrolase family protein [Alphaproteobacteria bacterium]